MSLPDVNLVDFWVLSYVIWSNLVLPWGRVLSCNFRIKWNNLCRLVLTVMFSVPLNFLILFLWRSPMVSVCSSVFKLSECLCCYPLCDLYSFAYFIHSVKPFFSHCLLSSTSLPECLFFCNYLNVISPLSFWLHLYLLVCSASLFISLSHRYQRTIGRDGWHRCVTAATICKIFCSTLYFSYLLPHF